jgi:hypothetical protein
MRTEERDNETYHALQVANEKSLEDLTRLVTVADILKGFSSILTTHVEENFLTTAKGQLVSICCKRPRLSSSSEQRSNLRVLIYEAGAVVDLIVDHEVEVLLGAVLRNLGVGKLLGRHGGCVLKRGLRRQV